MFSFVFLRLLQVSLLYLWWMGLLINLYLVWYSVCCTLTYEIFILSNLVDINIIVGFRMYDFLFIKLMFDIDQSRLLL